MNTKKLVISMLMGILFIAVLWCLSIMTCRSSDIESQPNNDSFKYRGANITSEDSLQRMLADGHANLFHISDTFDPSQPPWMSTFSVKKIPYAKIRVVPFKVMGETILSGSISGTITNFPVDMNIPVQWYVEEELKQCNVVLRVPDIIKNDHDLLMEICFNFTTDDCFISFMITDNEYWDKFRWIYSDGTDVNYKSFYNENGDEENSLVDVFMYNSDPSNEDDFLRMKFDRNSKRIIVPNQVIYDLLQHWRNKTFLIFPSPFYRKESFYFSDEWDVLIKNDK